MSFNDWIVQTKRRYAEYDAWTATTASINELYTGVVRQVGKSINYGESVWDEDWDVLIILDACRYDLWQQSVSERDDFAPATPRYSVASMSNEFMEKEFRDSEIPENTGLVTSNPLSRQNDLSGFDRVEEVWRDGWSDDLGNTPPSAPCQTGMEVWREDNLDRMIVWIMQPHAPFRRSGRGRLDNIRDSWGAESISEYPENVWNKLRDGEYDADQLWRDYKDNLHYALDDVDTLLRHLDAEQVCITSDHANLMGEGWMYGHPRDVPHPTLKRVPWIEYGPSRDTGGDPWESDTAETETSVESETTVEDRLESLGYV